MKTITANQLRGRAIGSIFFSVFGAAWLGLSFYVREIWNARNIALLVTGAALLIAACFWLYRQAANWPTVPEDPARSRAFNRINAIQWIAIVIVATAFARLRIDAYVLSAIAAIVGIHLFPLARLFGQPMHNVTGAALVLWASASVLIVPPEHLQGITALGTGIILWTSAAISLTISIVVANRTSPLRRPVQA